MIKQDNNRLQSDLDEERRMAANLERQINRLQQHLDSAEKRANSKSTEVRRVSFGDNSLDDALGLASAERSESASGDRSSPTSMKNPDVDDMVQPAMVRTKSGKKHKLSGAKKTELGLEDGLMKKGKSWREQVCDPNWE